MAPSMQVLRVVLAGLGLCCRAWGVYPKQPFRVMCQVSGFAIG